MRGRGRRIAGGALAAWALAAACGDAERGAGAGGRVDPALARDLQLAAAASVELAAPDVGAARFLPAVDEAAPAASAPARRRTMRAARRPAPTVIATAAAPAPAPAVLSVALAPSPEPQPERMQRYAGEEGVSTAVVGVVLRGGAAGDDKCERELPRPRPAAGAVAFRPHVVRLGGLPPAGARPTGAVPYAAPYAPPF
jgi:hypothetical protein